MKAPKDALVLAMLLVWTCLSLMAQETGPGAGNAVTDPTKALPVPSPLNTGAYSLDFAPELEMTNYVDLGISVGLAFDDNVLNSRENPVSDVSYSFLPHISLRQSRGPLNWKLNYSGGFIMYERVSAYNQGSHDLGFEAQYSFTPHLNFIVRDHFFMTTGFFDQVSHNPDVGIGSILQQPNQFVVLPLAKQNRNVGTAAISYQFTPNSSIGASGTSYESRYHDVPLGSTLLDTHSQEAEAFYNHHIVAKDTLGLTYRFQKFTFDPASENTRVHSILIVDTVSITPHMSVSIFAGPQHTDIATQATVPVFVFPFVFLSTTPISESSWSLAAGASYQWNGQRTSITANFSRTVSDGGGLVTTTQLTGVDVAVRRQWTRSVSVGIAGSYGINDVLSTASSRYPSFNATLGSLFVSRRIGSNVDLTAGYSRAALQYKNNVPGLGNVGHNRAWVSFSYDFSRTIGR